MLHHWTRRPGLSSLTSTARWRCRTSRDTRTRHAPCAWHHAGVLMARSRRAHPDVNQGPAYLQSAALTTELCTQVADDDSDRVICCANIRVVGPWRARNSPGMHGMQGMHGMHGMHGRPGRQPAGSAARQPDCRAAGESAPAKRVITQPNGYLICFLPASLGGMYVSLEDWVPIQLGTH